MIRTIFLTVVVLLAASAATGEYYKYTDENGNVRFTDDMTQVPELRQDAVEKFASETTSGTEEETPSYGALQPEMNATDEPLPEKYAVPEGDTFEIRATELNKIQAELNKTRQALEKERADIESMAPAEDATSKEKIAYKIQVDRLNAKIEKYEKDLKAFEEKVEAFNNRGKVKAE